MLVTVQAGSACTGDAHTKMKSKKSALQLLLAPLFVLTLVWIADAQSRDSKSSQVSFCTVLSSPEKFLNKRITFAARVRATLFQPAVLVAASGCPGESVLFEFSD